MAVIMEQSPGGITRRGATSAAGASRMGGAALVAMRGVARMVWRAVREFTGETRYDRYVEHQCRTHPGQPVLSPREFWREEYAAQGNNPGSRCC